MIKHSRLRVSERYMYRIAFEILQSNLEILPGERCRTACISRWLFFKRRQAAEWFPDARRPGMKPARNIPEKPADILCW